MNSVHPLFQPLIDSIAPPMRQARCHCGRTEPSSPQKQFAFEYRGPGSQRAREQCKHCGYFECAHGTGKPHLKHIEGHTFEPHGPYEFDAFYCGCQGWD